MRSRVFVLPVLQKLEELLSSPLLEQAHQWTLYCFHLSTGDLGDPSIAIHKATSDLLELEVAGNLGVDKDPSELSRGNDELGDEIYSVVTITPELRWGCLVRTKLAIQLAMRYISYLVGIESKQ